jgi:hypothetical protein
VEAAEQRLDLESGDVAEAFLLGVGHPPQRDDAFIPDEVDPVVGRYVANLLPRVASYLALALHLDGDERAEREHVPGEAAARPEGRGDSLEELPLVVPGAEVHQ